MQAHSTTIWIKKSRFHYDSPTIIPNQSSQPFSISFNAIHLLHCIQIHSNHEIHPTPQMTDKEKHPPCHYLTPPLSLSTLSSTPTLTPQIPIHATQNQTTHSTPIESNSNAPWCLYLRWTRNHHRFDSARTVRYPLFQVVSVSHSPTSLSIDSMQIRFNTLSGT